MSSRVAMKLREAIQAYKRRTGERMTYRILAERTGIALGTLQNLGSHPYFNTTLTTVGKICDALSITPADLLELVPNPPERGTKSKPKRTRKK